MSIILTGDASNVTSPLTATIASIASVGGHFRCTTSSAHLFGNGDTVNLALTVSSVPKNATVTIAVIDATHFDILSSLSFDPTGGTGTATDLSLTPQIQVPTDGDTFSLQLSGMLSAIQALCDRTQALKKFAATGFRLVTLTYTATTTGVLFPAWTIAAWVEGCGGGGGGGGGGSGVNASGQSAVAGAGGGGASGRVQFFEPQAGHSYAFNIGGGGAGGAGAPSTGSASFGSNGTASTVVDSTASATVATFPGGGGGGRGLVATGTANRHSCGGFSIASPYTPEVSATANAGIPLALGAGCGGDGIDNTSGLSNVGWPCMPVDYTGSVAGITYAGGNGGTLGANGGASFNGGGGGGGGGGGPFGIGANGGNGGNGASGTGGSGTAGANAAANTGAGGGGGGAGGGAATPGGGGNGGNGGSGLIVVRYLVPGGVP